MAHDFRQLGGWEVPGETPVDASLRQFCQEERTAFSENVNPATRKLVCCLLTAPGPCHHGSQGDDLVTRWPLSGRAAPGTVTARLAKAVFGRPALLPRASADACLPPVPICSSRLCPGSWLSYTETVSPHIPRALPYSVMIDVMKGKYPYQAKYSAFYILLMQLPRVMCAHVPPIACVSVLFPFFFFNPPQRTDVVGRNFKN